MFAEVLELAVCACLTFSTEQWGGRLEMGFGKMFNSWGSTVNFVGGYLGIGMLAGC